MDKFKWIVVVLLLIIIGMNAHLFSRLRKVEDEQSQQAVRWIKILERVDTAEKEID